MKLHSLIILDVKETPFKKYVYPFFPLALSSNTWMFFLLNQKAMQHKRSWHLLKVPARSTHFLNFFNNMQSFYIIIHFYNMYSKNYIIYIINK